MTQTSANPFSFDTIPANGMQLHCASCGSDSNPVFLFLHGFPEFWAGWSEVMPHVAATHHCVAPDQRGYNLSSKPQALEAYAARNLVEDIAALADRLSPDTKFVLAGHDWGASVAYAFAMRYPERLSGLVIANGVHPAPFQNALLTDPRQIAASQYIHFLRSPRAEEVLSRNGCEKLLGMLGGFSDTSFLDDTKRDAYLEAWSRPGALTAMLNWYRASPLYVPLGDEKPDRTKSLELPPEFLKVEVPHLLIYGTQDRALLASAFEGVEAFARDIEVHHVDDAGHWILHEQPDAVAATIIDWLGRRAL
jgi:pimeloyl-ACP methyl ester carboxylesterase